MNVTSNFLFSKKEILLLDQLPLLTPGVAFSIRRLTRRYVGPLIRVRRSSDNAELDIPYLSNGNLDVATLMGFVDGGSGFIRTWYDQSGNAVNAVQTVAGNQPRIVSSGVMSAINNVPSIEFSQALTSRLTVNINSSNYNSAGTINSVVRLSSIVGGYRPIFIFLAAVASAAGFGELSGSSSFGLFGVNIGDVLNGGPVAANTNYVTTGSWTNSSNAFVKINSNSVSTSIGNIYTQSGTGQIGYTNFTTGYLNGSVSDVIVFSSQISDGTLAVIENNQRSYYGI